MVERYQGRMVNFIQRSIGDRDRAEDLAQEVFVRVYRHIKRFDTSKKFDVDLHHRLEPGEERAPQSLAEPLVLFQTLTSSWDDDHRPLQFEDSSMRPDDLFRKRHLQELVERAAGELPEHHREVFILREIEEDVRGDRRDNGYPAGNREVAPESGAEPVRADHRALAGVGGGVESIIPGGET